MSDTLPGSVTQVKPSFHFWKVFKSERAECLFPSTLAVTVKCTKLQEFEVCHWKMYEKLKEKDRRERSVAYIMSICRHTWLTLDHMGRWKLFGHVTASIRILTLTSLPTHGYFWMSSVNKLTPLPAFVNSSWWCLWCSLHVYQLGKSLWFHESCACRSGPLCAVQARPHTHQAADFMVTFRATMSPFHLSPLGSNESFH